MTWPKTTLAIGVASVAAGGMMMLGLPQQMMPYADRNQFAVEIYLPTGTTLDKTQQVADNLKHILNREKRIASFTTSRKTTSSAWRRFQYPSLVGGAAATP